MTESRNALQILTEKSFDKSRFHFFGAKFLAINFCRNSFFKHESFIICRWLKSVNLKKSFCIKMTAIQLNVQRLFRFVQPLTSRENAIHIVQGRWNLGGQD